MTQGRDEFYIGYEPVMPPRMRRAVAAAVATAVAAALIAALTFVGLQRDLAESRFEYGHVRTFDGYLALTPAPVLHVAGAAAFQPHWLVAQGKFGPETALDGAAPGWVTLSGTLIERGQWRMIEIVAGSVRAVAARSAAPPAVDAGAERVTLRGEIVDSKCFLGVMNPGERTVHRDCAVRCLDGGIPVMFAFADGSRSRLALLLGADAETLRGGIGRQTTLSGVLSGPEESLVFTLDAARDQGHR